MANFTLKFEEAFERVKRVAEQEGEQAARSAFRDEMLALGHHERIQNLYRVQDKLSKKAKFFRPNKSQERYFKFKKQHSRAAVLKCRQVGFTTAECIDKLDRCLFEANSRCGIMCHKLEVVKTIFDDVTKFSYDWFVKDWGHLYNPTQQSDSATSLVFSDDGTGRPLNSSMRVLFDFRGKTVHHLHISEAHRIEDERLLGSVNGVPDNGDVTYETTANGRIGEFYRLWQLHRSNPTSAPVKGFFVPWFEHYPEEPGDWVPPANTEWTHYEQELLELYPNQITPEHLMWRRWCILAKCGGSVEKFEQEYPTNDIDCFSSGEHNVFSSAIVKLLERGVKDPSKVGFLLQNGSRLELHDDPKGTIFIWELPKPGESYAMGADPAGGVGRDRAASYVFSQKTHRIVAKLWGQIEPKDFAKELFKLGKYYNSAWMCVEANNHGHLVLSTLVDLGYRNLYKRHEIDIITQKPTRKVGFLTTNESKMIITEHLKTACKEGQFVCPDIELMAEMTSFVQVASKTGRSIRREALPGAHDDLIMAASLTAEMHNMRPLFDDSAEIDLTGLEYDDDTGFVIGEADVG